MNKDKNGFDEMQQQQRNRIGNQMFTLMFFALLLNGGLHGMGYIWLEYPVNVMIIITACMGVYLVRLIAANAYLPAKATQNRGGVVRLAIAVAFTAGLAVAIVLLLRQGGLSPAENGGDNSALILFIVSTVGLLVALVAAAIRKAGNKGDGE